MKASKAAFDLIKKYEGFRSEPYLCPAGHWTVGWGHVVRRGEQFDTLTREEAEELLRKDVALAETAVNELVRVDLHQEHFDALVSYVFNVGFHNFKTSTLLRKLNAGQYVDASEEFDRWVYVTRDGRKIRMKGLVNRRNDEEELFLSLPWQTKE